MCGIVGFINPRQVYTDEDLGQIIIKMTEALRHRGPDSDGHWTDARDGVALGHRRLAVLDLSEGGYQPMISLSGRYLLVFNGEIYNFQQIRSELQQDFSIHFATSSDTEVILAAVERWGIMSTLRKLTGMFAFALWDRFERTLFLARDRLGEKPLYYGTVRGTFVFGSELKGICEYPSFNGEIDRDAVTLFMRHNYIPAPYSIYKGIYKLSPGTILTLKANENSVEYTTQTYWSAFDVVTEQLDTPYKGSEEDAIVELHDLLQKSIKGQMTSDVPFGAFLSGGIDSSTVVALMQSQSKEPIRTFSIGFDDESFDEAGFARRVAKHLGTQHTELYVTSKEAIKTIPKLSRLYDEPFADSSQIPTHLVAELARKHVTVSLSGDGGDELFGGYNRYFMANSFWRKIKGLPLPVRHLFGRVLTSLSPGTWENILGGVSSRFKYPDLGDKIYKFADLMASKGPNDLYKSLISHWKNPHDIVCGGNEPKTPISNADLWASFPDGVQAMMFLDLVTYLPDDILVKVDRAAMGCSLETRVPMLDHQVVEFAWKLPMSMKIKGGQSKWILKQVLYKYVPRELIDRPKMGFGIPVRQWLKGDLREWAEDLLDESRIRSQGILVADTVSRTWNSFISGKGGSQHSLWNVLMFQAWLRDNKHVL